MNENKKLLDGEKYLLIKITGHNLVAAFKNKDKNKPNQPDYKSDGVAIWVTTKKERTNKVSEENIL